MTECKHETSKYSKLEIISPLVQHLSSSFTLTLSTVLWRVCWSYSSLTLDCYFFASGMAINVECFFCSYKYWLKVNSNKFQNIHLLHPLHLFSVIRPFKCILMAQNKRLIKINIVFTSRKAGQVVLLDLFIFSSSFLVLRIRVSLRVKTS